jgi:hypothetical protein
MGWKAGKANGMTRGPMLPLAPAFSWLCPSGGLRCPHFLFDFNQGCFLKWKFLSHSKRRSNEVYLTMVGNTEIDTNIEKKIHGRFQNIPILSENIFSFCDHQDFTEEELLKNDLRNSLYQQGFLINKNERLDIGIHNKENFRKVQLFARNEILKQRGEFILKHSHLAKKYAVNGENINPLNINLQLRQVLPNTEDELLFRWWNLSWWSMPYQKPYGRQMRFVIWDTYHQAPFGLISLQSPILKQAIRDKFLEIPKEGLDYWVNRSMSAQRVGALPPYNELLGGKLVAITLACNEIREAYKNKYEDYNTLMLGRSLDPNLLFITTSSAFGKSSLYSRLKIDNDCIAEKLGYTEGYGSFQIPETLYQRILTYLEKHGKDITRGYGGGPSKKLKLIQLACRELGILDYSRHGIKREYYLFPLVFNLNSIIKDQALPEWKNYGFDKLVDYWKNRWLNKRIKNSDRYREFNIDDYIGNLRKLIKGDEANDR